MRTFLKAERLNIGLTERCNAKCSHCQCGDARSNDMSKQIMEKIFDEVKIVGTLYLMGGELMLKPEVIDTLVKVLIAKDVQVDNFYLHTNGTLYNEKYFENLVQLKKLCKEQEGGNINISFDKFHRDEGNRILGEEQYQQNIARIAAHPLFLDFELMADVFLMGEGRAKNLDGGDIIVFEPTDELKEISYMPLNISERFKVAYVSQINISTLGDIVNENNYDEQKKNSLGNVMNSTINDALLRSRHTKQFQDRDWTKWNERINEKNTKLHMMQVYASAKRLKINPERILDVFT